MSDIPQARQLIAEVMQMTGVDEPAKLKLGMALVLMRRSPAMCRGEAEPEEITAEIKAEVMHLAHYTRLTYHQIADHVGVHNIGRISEIVRGLR